MSAAREHWVEVLSKDALNLGDVTPVSVGERTLALYDGPDRLYVTQALCTHAGANLCDGYFDGYSIECPLHQGCFDIRTGEPRGAPVTRPLRTYPVREIDGVIQVRLDKPADV